MKGRCIHTHAYKPARQFPHPFPWRRSPPPFTSCPSQPVSCRCSPGSRPASLASRLVWTVAQTAAAYAGGGHWEIPPSKRTGRYPPSPEPQGPAGEEGGGDGGRAPTEPPLRAAGCGIMGDSVGSVAKRVGTRPSTHDQAGLPSLRRGPPIARREQPPPGLPRTGGARFSTSRRR